MYVCRCVYLSHFNWCGQLAHGPGIVLTVEIQMLFSSNNASGKQMRVVS